MTTKPCEICGGDLPARSTRFCANAECKLEGMRKDEVLRRARERDGNIVNKLPSPCHRVGCDEILPPPKPRGGQQLYCSGDCKKIARKMRRGARTKVAYPDFSGMDVETVGGFGR